MLLARRFTINPVLVILSLVFWYWMWGVPGAILSTPMLAITKIISDRIRPLMVFGHFMEGYWLMEAPPLERRLAAILAADVEGYSRLMHGDEEATMATLSAHRGLVDDLIARHRGGIANTAGDSVLAEFASVLDAVHCAVEIQGALEGGNDGDPEGRRM